MPKFAYTALDENGERVEGVMTAESQTTIRRELQDQGFRPLSVAPKSSVLQLEITKEKVSKEEVMHFSRQLSVFIKAGIPIMEALRVIGDEVQDKLMKKIIFDMIEAIYDGETFAAAAASHPEAFPNYYIGMLQSAELTGNLDGTLNQLADYMKRDIDARAKLKSALIYPAVVMALSVVVVLILTVYVLPKFQVFFKQLNAKLPLPTRMLLGLSGFMSSYWWLLMIIAIGGVITIVAMRRNPVGRARIDEFLLRVPVLGDLIRTAIIERTCRVLASMIDTGVPLPDALSVAADCANNTVYREGLDHIRSQMMEGRGLAAPLSETGLFPGAAHQMFRVGEETGTLNDQMDVAADYYSRELDVKLSNFTSLFEPAIIIAVGIVVGFVAVALVSAMYGIYNQVKAT